MEKLTRAGEAKSLAEKAKTDAENFIAENDALWNEIRKLDQDVKNAVNAKSEAETRKKKAAGALAKAADDLEKAKNDIKSIEPQVETLKQTQESNAKDSKLTGIILQSETFVSNIRKLDADIKKAEQAKTAAAKDIAKVEDNFKVAFQRKQELLDEQNELFRNEVLVLANVIQKHLVEGEACPVCGSKNYTMTLVGFPLDSSKPEEYKDRNACVCQDCGWKGIAHELVPDKK
jgi:DNA repair exonuclease SbcCD ATPase subunit